MGYSEWLFQHSAKSFPTKDLSCNVCRMPNPLGLCADACSIPWAIPICCYDPSVWPAGIVKPRLVPATCKLRPRAALPAGVGHHTSRRLDQNGRRCACVIGCQDQQTGAWGQCHRLSLLPLEAVEHRVTVGAIHVDCVTSSNGHIYGERWRQNRYTYMYQCVVLHA